MTSAPSERIDARDQPWPMRPWIMAGIAAFAARIFWMFAERAVDVDGDRWYAVGATLIAVATVTFVLTVEVRRWIWALAFALGWGVVIGLVGYSARGYNVNSTIFEWPFLASIFAVLLAAPLFQSARDEGAWRFPPMAVQMHAWTDAVIGAAALLFVGITFALIALIAGLFHLIGIDLITDMLEEAWFDWMLAGFAFGAGIGLLRERDALVATMQRLVRIILSVLAPVLAFALALFLVSLPLTGLSGLWDGWVSAAALTLIAAAGAYVLINAVIGPEEDGQNLNTVLRISALVLAVVVLPLALLADSALLLRVGQYGWTPERIWGVICALVATGFGIAGWWAVIKQRMAFPAMLRTLQTRLAVGVCGLALLLSMPIIDFGAISAHDQLSRLKSGAVKPADFDWTAMAFDFGPTGRAALADIARRGPADQRPLATAALRSESRYGVTAETNAVDSGNRVRAALQIRPAGRALSETALRKVADVQLCNAGRCIGLWLDTDRFLLIGRRDSNSQIETALFTRDDDEVNWSYDYISRNGAGRDEVPVDLGSAGIDVRTVSRRQLYIDGKPASDIFE